MDIFSIVNNDLDKIALNYAGVQSVEQMPYLKGIRHTIPPVKIGMDYSSNIAMVLAKALSKNIDEVTTDLADKIKSLDYIKSVDIVKGYLNIIFKDEFWEKFLASIYHDGKAYGDGKEGDTVLLEFISANPTGPLHVGHCRGAILGLAISKIMKKAGYNVIKEYYINDYGEQINHLVDSVQFRYEQQCGLREDENVPEGCYPGDYIIDYAKQIFEEFGDKYVGLSSQEFFKLFKDKTVNAMMDIIRADLRLLGVEFDSFVSETEIAQSGKIQDAVDFLKAQSKEITNENGEIESVAYVYEGHLEPPKGGFTPSDDKEDYEAKSNQTIFRSTLFGDDADRVLVRDNGKTTYFASDIAYHKTKVDRGFEHLINLFGADHVGYVKRLKSAVAAMAGHELDFTILLCQMVALEKDGVPFKMSKRKGNFVTLRDVAEEVDVDELKLFMLSKTSDSPMTFDMVKVKEKSADNIIYYIQYAFVRTLSILKKYEETFGQKYEFNDADFAGFISTCSKQTKEIVVNLAKFPSLIQASAKNKAPHLVVEYMKNISSAFHSMWGSSKIINEDDQNYTKAMMAFVSVFQTVLGNALDCLGIKPKEQM